MSLIERLGGYKNSKGIREAYVSNGWSVSDVCKGFHEYFTIEDLDCALLEYRRQHNTFEIGDLYVFTEKYSKQSVIHKVDSLNSGKGCIRHATPEEIKAWRRL